MLKFEVVVPDYKIEFPNEEQTVRAMTEAVKSDVVRRLAFGRGSQGALPRPKDGGRAYHRTGTLAASIGIAVRQKHRKRGTETISRWEGVVRAFGPRPADENAAEKAKRARAATQERRAQLALALTLQSLGGATVDARYLRKTPTKSGNIFKVSSIRSRAADTNAALAAILSQPPRDPAGRAGNRGQYRVFESTPQYERTAYEVAAAELYYRVTG